MARNETTTKYSTESQRRLAHTNPDEPRGRTTPRDCTFLDVTTLTGATCCSFRAVCTGDTHTHRTHERFETFQKREQVISEAQSNTDEQNKTERGKERQAGQGTTWAARHCGAWWWRILFLCRSWSAVVLAFFMLPSSKHLTKKSECEEKDTQAALRCDLNARTTGAKHCTLVWGPHNDGAMLLSHCPLSGSLQCDWRAGHTMSRAVSRRRWRPPFSRREGGWSGSWSVASAACGAAIDTSSRNKPNEREHWKLRSKTGERPVVEQGVVRRCARPRPASPLPSKHGRAVRRTTSHVSLHIRRTHATLNTHK